MKTRFSFWKIASGIWKADRQRTHHLCNMGGAIQSISKEADSLTRVEFYSLMEQVFALPAVQQLVDTAVQNHKEGVDR